MSWTAPAIGSVGGVGVITVSLKGHGDVKMFPTVAGSNGQLTVSAASWNEGKSALTVAYSSGKSTVHVVVQVKPIDTGVQAIFDADQPVITAVDMGRWPPSLGVRSITVPYYSPGVWFSPAISAYMNVWWDWHTTNASRLNGSAAVYQPKTDGTLNKVHEQMELVVSPDLDATLPSLGNPASPYRAVLAGRMVLDIWESGFGAIRSDLAELGDYGIDNCVAIIHDWQKYGYDNGLPEHYPANAKLGGDDGLKSTIARGTANGCLMALHENYEDYYPNYPKFNANAVALAGDGGDLKSWKNTDTGIQSLSTKAEWMLPNAETQSPAIHAQYGTTADYLDEHSALPPWAHEDMDAKSHGAGMLTTMLQANRDLWAYERKTHRGPVLGEGSAHWFYSGLLDGVEAQQEAGYKTAMLGPALPLFVDFDLLRIHPLQINHGMGYYERWSKTKSSRMTESDLDAYRMQEIAFGHAPFLSKGTWNDVSRAFVESNLVTPVAKLYGTSSVKSIEYKTNSGWVSSSIAAPAGEFSQVQVAYENGLTVVANANEKPLTWNGLTIPQNGWAAKSADLTAYTALCAATICDFSRTPTSLFANARNKFDAQIGTAYARPSIESVTQSGLRRFAITYAWDDFRSIGVEPDYKVFAHFVAEGSGVGDSIAFQDIHRPDIPVGQWKPGQRITDGSTVVTIPPSVKDGRYSIRAGIYDSVSGRRLPLLGKNDGSNRYILGYLTVEENGAHIRFSPGERLSTDRQEPTATDGLVDFGSVKTDGMMALSLKNGQWLLRTYPRYRNVSVLLNSEDFPEPALVSANGDDKSRISPIKNGHYWRLPLNNAKYYSWPQSTQKP